MTDASTTNRDRATEPLAADKSLGELVGDLTSDLGLLIRQEVALAKTEAAQEAKRMGKGAGLIAGAGVAVWMALTLLSLALAWLLDKSLDRGLSFAIVGIVWAAIAIVLYIRGRHEISAVQALPTTVQTLKEDAQWIKTQKN